MLALATPRVEAEHGEQLLARRGERACMACERAVGDLRQADAADPRRRTREVLLDEFARQTDCLEDLRAAVRRHGRDPHLRHRLQQALRDALRRARLRLVRRQLAEPAELDELREGLEHEIRVDGGGAVADERRDAVHAARLAGFDDDARLQARPRAHQVVVHGGGHQERRHRHAIGAGLAVGEDEDVRAGGERDIRLRTDPLDAALESGSPFGGGPRRVDRPAHEGAGTYVTQLLELAVAQDRVRDHELARVLGRLVEQVALGADARGDAHHGRFADRVDRRIRHLREQLLEVRVEQWLAARQHGEGRVVAHRADSFLGVLRERREDYLHVLLRVTEQQLPRAQRVGRLLGLLRRRKIGQLHRLAVDPLGVRAARRDLALQLLVRDDASLREIDEEQLARLQAAAAHDVLGPLVEHAGLGREHDPAVRSLEPAAGAEPVAVERRADHAPVRERDRGRPVPRLHQAAVERVEAAQVVGNVVAALVRLGDHHHQRVRQRTAREHEQLEHVVERRGVGAAGADHRQHLAQVVAEQL